MSGGSLDYISHNVEDIAGRIRGDTPLRRAFSKHLLLVARALHEIEWAQSGDTSPDNEDERKTILACLHPGAPLELLIGEAKNTMAELQAELKRLALKKGTES